MTEQYLDIDLTRQRLTLMQDESSCREYAVSTAANGVGEANGSLCTPRGWHRIRARIGAGARPGTVFVGRRPTGEVYTPELGRQYPNRDWILTRILWLCGNEPGRNRFGHVDTMRRYIYIHGAPDSARMGEPGSHGCVRMPHAEVIDLFDRVAAGTRVYLHE